MKVRLVGLMALCCALALIVAFSSTNPSHSQNTSVSTGTVLSQAEQDVLTEINLARGNPSSYATYPENLKPFFNGKGYQPTGHLALTTQEGWAAVEDAIKFLRATKPLAPLTASSGLTLSAVAHVKDCRRKDSHRLRPARFQMASPVLRRDFGLCPCGRLRPMRSDTSLRVNDS